MVTSVLPHETLLFVRNYAGSPEIRQKGKNRLLRFSQSSIHRIEIFSRRPDHDESYRSNHVFLYP